MTVFVANTNVIELIGLKSNIDEAFINDATVTVTVIDPAGEEVSGPSWPIEMGFVDDSSGDYRAILAHDLPFEPKKKYKAVIDADGGSNRVGHWEFTFSPQTRTG